MSSWRDKPARIQVKEKDLPSTIPQQNGLSFNVWYNKWSQGGSGNGGDRFVNPFKLEPTLHSGLTLGDKEGSRVFCLYFAKGMCCLGKKCHYLHHVPDEEDNLKLKGNDVLDCFGREKFSSYRDDMGGVGSFLKLNRSLYVGGISGAINNKTNLKPSQIESRIRFTFGKLGDVESVRYIACLLYTSRCV